MSVRFSFKRSGEIIASPRLTFATAGVPPDDPRHLSQGDQRLARRLRAAEIHRRPRRRLAGRPIAIRYVDNRELEKQQVTP